MPRMLTSIAYRISLPPRHRADNEDIDKRGLWIGRESNRVPSDYVVTRYPLS